MTRPFLLAQLSDLHIKAHGRLAYGRVDTVGMLRACVQHLLRLKQQPDAVAITGDLTDLGQPEEYAVLRELLAPLTMPLYVIPGNHDERNALRIAFADHAYLRQSPGFIQYAIEAHPLRIVAIDTVVAGESGGELCTERIAWLDRTLTQAPDRPTVVLMHHPPFRTFIGHMDAFGLRSPEALAAVVKRHPRVEAILCGHVHRAIEVRFAGTIASTAPSAAHQVALDFDVDAPSRFVMEPPAYRLHAYSAATGLVSHTAYVGEFAGPYLFREPGRPGAEMT
ncbi:MAG: phosphodiesterase [Betaproteobacteria bacterium]|nr:phosphodiesterase [Betaproteobacteria bacterium]